jgi:hypothetical protein
MIFGFLLEDDQGLILGILMAMKNNHLYSCLKPDISQVIDEMSLSPCYYWLIIAKMCKSFLLFFLCRFGHFLGKIKAN